MDVNIIEYNNKFDEQIKDLIVELQNYLIDIDNWHTLVMIPEFREGILKLDLNNVENKNGKIYLAVKNNNLLGLIIGYIEDKDEEDKLTNDCAKCGFVSELIVKNQSRGNGIGKILLNKIEEYFKSVNCKRVNIEVFGPNKKGLNFYEKNGYVIRDIFVSKKLY